MNVIQNILHPVDIPKITHIEIHTEEIEDKLIWILVRKWKFSVKFSVKLMEA